MERVDKVSIQKYASRNTSPKMPIEKKFVEAFVDSLLNSTTLQDISENIRQKIQNDNQFIVFNSYWPTARNINSEPFRSILAYAMLKKDFRLFELISHSLFTGSVEEYHGSNLYSSAVKFTDEVPIRYTDERIYTDMSEGEVQIVFKNVYTEYYLEDGSGSEYQLWSEYMKALEKFSDIITMTKPARCQVLTLHVPYCYLSGDTEEVKSINIQTDDSYFESPFGPNNKSLSIISSLSFAQLVSCYSTCYMYSPETGLSKDIEMTLRTIKRLPEYVLFQYEFRTQASNTIWDNIVLSVGASSNVLYVSTKQYDHTKTFFEGYKPILLRLNDNDPDGPVLALDSTHTVASLFYTRYKAEEEDTNG